MTPNNTLGGTQSIKNCNQQSIKNSSPAVFECNSTEFAIEHLDLTTIFNLFEQSSLELLESHLLALLV